MEYYFKFNIPENICEKSGVCGYPEGWFGQIEKFCPPPKDVTILMYNEKDKFGLAKTSNNLITKAEGNITLITQSEADTIMEIKPDPKIWTTNTIWTKWKTEEVANA